MWFFNSPLYRSIFPETGVGYGIWCTHSVSCWPRCLWGCFWHESHCPVLFFWWCYATTWAAFQGWCSGQWCETQGVSPGIQWLSPSLSAHSTCLGRSVGVWCDLLGLLTFIFQPLSPHQRGCTHWTWLTAVHVSQLWITWDIVSTARSQAHLDVCISSLMTCVMSPLSQI